MGFCCFNAQNNMTPEFSPLSRELFFKTNCDVWSYLLAWWNHFQRQKFAGIGNWSPFFREKIWKLSLICFKQNIKYRLCMMKTFWNVSFSQKKKMVWNFMQIVKPCFLIKNTISLLSAEFTSAGFMEVYWREQWLLQDSSWKHAYILTPLNPTFI